MQENLRQILRDSISKVFETTFFLVLEEAGDLEAQLLGAPAKGWYQGRVKLSCPPKQAVVWVWAPPELAEELATNMLAAEPGELSQAEIMDAYKEMLNMVSGRLLTAMDPSGSWSMGLPEAGVVEAESVAALVGVVAEPVVLQADGRGLICGCELVGEE